MAPPIFSTCDAAFPSKDNGTEPISIMFNKVGEHIWWDFGPFLHAEPFKILHILRCALVDSPLQFRPHFFDRVKVRWLRWPLQNIDFVFREPFLCWFLIAIHYVWGHCWKVHLRSSLSFLAEATRCLVKMSWYLVEFIMPLILTRAPWITGSKTAPKHQCSTIFDGRYEVLFLVCIPLLTPKMPTVYMVYNENSIHFHFFFLFLEPFGIPGTFSCKPNPPAIILHNNTKHDTKRWKWSYFNIRFFSGDKKKLWIQ